MFLHLSVNHSVHMGQGVSISESSRTETRSRYGNERAVRIILECFLVTVDFTLSESKHESEIYL